MKVSKYYEKNKETLPEELAEILNNEQSIWTNDAAYGYCISAMEAAGYSSQEISDMIHYLHSAFDNYTVEEAEKKWQNWMMW